MPDAKLTALTALAAPTLDDLLYIVDDAAGVPVSRKTTADAIGGLFLPSACQGRLTLTSGVPVPTSDVIVATTIYFTPYNGNRVALYDGTRWKLYVLTERSLALGTLTASLPYDVFLYDNAGTLTMELTAWTNGTTRATALVAQDGVYVKTGATTRRWVGTFYTASTTTTEDSKAKRFVFNAQNLVPRPVAKDFPAAWTYATNTAREVNGSTAYRVEVMVGLADVAIADIRASALIGGSGNSRYSIGDNSTTTGATGAQVFGVNPATAYVVVTAAYHMPMTLGHHYFAFLEQATTPTSDCYGDATIGTLGFRGTVEI